MVVIIIIIITIIIIIIAPRFVHARVEQQALLFVVFFVALFHC